MIELTGKKIEIDERVVRCDFCKKIMDAGSNKLDGLEHSVTLNFSFGYFSDRDGDNFQWDACSKCGNEIAVLLEKYKKEKV